jgi:hypothetical protein
VFLTPNYEELAKDNGDGSLRPYRPNCMAPSSAMVPISALQAAEKLGLELGLGLMSDQTKENYEINLSTSESRLVVERVKIFADGSLGAETAALRVSGSKEDLEDRDIEKDIERDIASPKVRVKVRVKVKVNLLFFKS